MAIRTVSNTGGLFSSAATWVGGIMPSQGTQQDTIAFTATSGPLIVDGLYYIAGINYTNWTNTLTFNLGCLLGFDEQLVNTPFINMGTGGYTIIDNSVGGGYDFSTVSTRPIILTNNSAIPSSVYFNYTGTTALQITGHWIQNGNCSNTYFVITTGTFTYNGTVIGGSFSGTLSSGTILNGNITDPTITDISLYGDGTLNTTFNDVNGGGITTPAQATLTSNGSIDFLYINGSVTIIGTPNISSAEIQDNGFLTPVAVRNIDMGSSIISDFLFTQNTSSGIISTSLNLLSLLVCNKLYLRCSDFGFVNKFTGAFGFVCNELIMDDTSGIRAYEFQSGVEYKVNTSIKIDAPFIIRSTTPGVKTKITLGPTINQNTIAYLTATDIDCSLGRRMNNFYGTATNCDNIRVWNDNTLPQVPSTF